MGLIGYEEVRDALTGDRKFMTPDDFAKWMDLTAIEKEGFAKVGVDLAQVALQDMRERNRTLLEALVGMFTSGFIGAFDLALSECAETMGVESQELRDAIVARRS